MSEKNLLIGIGGSGCKITEMVADNLIQLNISTDCVSIDTDIRDLERVCSGDVIAMVSHNRLSDVVDVLPDGLTQQWFPGKKSAMTGFYSSLEMDKGANLWRSKALLSFYDFLNEEKRKAQLIEKIDALMANDTDEEHVRVFIVASLAGGTGSGLILPFTLYIKEYVREKYQKELAVEAFLISPNVYSSSLSAEQEVKANANAYACLKELNAVNTVVLSSNDSIGRVTAVDFKLGVKQDRVMGLLFDAKDKAFQNPQYKPFEKVYIFERQTGINTVSANEDILAGILTEKCKGTYAFNFEYQKEENSTAIFGSLSFSKIVYPKNSIVKYTVAKSLYDNVICDWLYLPSIIKNDIIREQRVAMQEGFVIPKTIENYRDKVFQFAKQKLDEKEDKGVLYGKPDLLRYLNQNSNIYCDFYSDKIDDYVDKLFSASNDKILCELLSGNYSSVSLPKCAGVKEIITQVAQKFYNTLCDMCEQLGNEERANREQFAQSLLDSQFECSFINDVLKDEDGAYVDPVWALTRLCALSSHLSEAIKNSKCASEERGLRVGDILEKCLLLDKADVRCRYAKFGKDRFNNLFKSNGRRYCGMRKADLRLFIQDLSQIYKDVKKEIYAGYYSVVLKAVNILIQKYQAFFDCFDKLREELSTDVKLALAENSKDVGLNIYVASSEQDKIKAYEAYTAFAVGKDSENYLYYEQACESVANFVLSNKDYEITSNGVYQLISDVKDGACQRFVQGEFYKNYIDKDVLEILLDPGSMVSTTEKESGRVQLRRAFSASKPTLKTDFSDRLKGRETTKNQKVLLFSNESYTYLDKVKYMDTTPSHAMNQILFEVGEYDGKIVFDKSIAPECICVCSEVQSLYLDYVSFVNEQNVDTLGYKCCQKAINMMQTQSTPLWNPYLNWNGHKGNRLPYISPVYQEEYEKTIAKALLYALISEQIFVQQIDGGKKKVYYRATESAVLPIAYMEDNVKESDLVSLMLWLREQDGLVEQWSSEFESVIKFDLDKIPSVGFGGSNVSGVYSAVHYSVAINGLKTRLLSLAFDFKNKCGSDYYALLLLNVGYDLFLRFCLHKLDEGSDAYISLYSSVLDDFLQAFLTKVKRVNKETVDEFINFMNSNGLFRKMGEFGQLVDINLQDK